MQLTTPERRWLALRMQADEVTVPSWDTILNHPDIPIIADEQDLMRIYANADSRATLREYDRATSIQVSWPPSKQIADPAPLLPEHDGSLWPGIWFAVSVGVVAGFLLGFSIGYIS